MISGQWPVKGESGAEFSSRGSRCSVDGDPSAALGTAGELRAGEWLQFISHLLTSGVKTPELWRLSGTAEAVPLRRRFVRWLLVASEPWASPAETATEL